MTSYSAISNLISNASVVEIPSAFAVADFNNSDIINDREFRYAFSYGDYLVFSTTQINEKSIDDCTNIDEINNNYLDKVFIGYMIDNYGSSLIAQLGRNVTNQDLANAEWIISEYEDQTVEMYPTPITSTMISQITVKCSYTINDTIYLRVVTITFDQKYSIKDIIDGNAGSPMVSRVYNTSIGTSNIRENLDLGETVIQTIDPDNTLEGNIWCNITNMFIEDGKYYRVITVYQITENGVEQYELRVEDFSSIPADPFIIITLIEEGKYSNASQSTEYTFSGMKIEQI